MICVDQALDLTFRHLELPPDARLFARAGAVGSEVAATFPEVRPQQAWLGQQFGGPLPNLGFQRCGGDAAAIASAAGMARVTGRAHIPPLIVTVSGANHPSAALVADQQRGQQVGMPGVVPLRELLVARQLLLSQTAWLMTSAGKR